MAAKPLQKPALVTAVAGTASNSYVSEVFADEYFGDKLEYEDWEAYTDAQHCRALVSATAEIDRELRGFGAWYAKYDFVDPEQSLMFPRAGDYDDSGNLEIPDAVEEATCLLALHLLMKRSGALGPVDVAAMQDANVQSVSTAGVNVFAGPRWSQWPREIRRLLSPYITATAQGTTRSRVRVRRWHEGEIAGTG